MATPVSAKGWLVPGEGGCSSSCSRSGSSAAAPFELLFRNGSEQYTVCRSGDAQIQTPALEYVDLPVTTDFTAIELLSLRTSGPVLVRFDGAPARVVTSAVFPHAALVDETLTFAADGYTLSATFAIGEDTPAEVARRINAAAALAGVPFMPARELNGQVEIHGDKSGPLGALSAFTGSAAPLLGLAGYAATNGTGQVLELDGLVVLQFKRTQGVRRVEISGSASVSVLAAGT